MDAFLIITKIILRKIALLLMKMDWFPWCATVKWILWIKGVEKKNKIKQNFSCINRKKNLIIKTEMNSSGEKTVSHQSTDKTIKYIYKSKLSLC